MIFMLRKSKEGRSWSKDSENNFLYVIIYLLMFITGIIFYFISDKDDSIGEVEKKRRKQHSIQAVAIGVIIVILYSVPFIGSVLGTLLWLYSLFIGYKASINEDVEIPFITEFAKKYA